MDLGRRGGPEMDPEGEGNLIPWNSGRVPSPHGGQFRCDDGVAQRQAHFVKSQWTLTGWKDLGGESSPRSLNMVLGCLLEPGSKNEQPGQGPREELHLGGQGNGHPC
jgi:hypothetical protein